MKQVHVYLDTKDMNLDDYVTYMYQNHFESKKANMEIIKRYLNKCYAKYIKVGQFVEEYALEGRGIIGLLGVLCDTTRQDEIARFGLRCYEESLVNKESIKTL